MKKNILVHLLLTIDICMFFLINRSINTISNNFMIQFWGLSIWIYLLISLVQATNAIVETKQTNTQKVLSSINMLSQIGILVIFTYAYILPSSQQNVKEVSVSSRASLIILIISETFTSLLYRNLYERYVVGGSNLDSSVVRNYTYNKIIKIIKLASVQNYLREEPCDISEIEKERVETSVINVFSLIFIVLISFFLKAY